MGLLVGRAIPPGSKLIVHVYLSSMAVIIAGGQLIVASRPPVHRCQGKSTSRRSRATLKRNVQRVPPLWSQDCGQMFLMPSLPSQNLANEVTPVLTRSPGGDGIFRRAGLHAPNFTSIDLIAGHRWRNKIGYCLLSRGPTMPEGSAVSRQEWATSEAVVFARED